jgi:hypothetical protein
MGKIVKPVKLSDSSRINDSNGKMLQIVSLIGDSQLNLSCSNLSKLDNVT